MEREEPSAGVWVHPSVRVGPSAIDGRGLFSTDNLVAGTIVARLGGRLVSSDELTALIDAADADPDAPYLDTMTVYEDRHLLLPQATLLHFGNHSCDPNTWHVGVYETHARRDICAGEELTIDYGTISGAPGFSMECHCSSPRCRGVVSSEDWRRVDLQDRYGDHWVPALLHAHRPRHDPITLDREPQKSCSAQR